MKRLISLICIIALILSTTGVVYAQSNESKETKIQLKIKQAEKLKKDGRLKEIQEKMDRYYNDNADKLVDVSVLDGGIDTPEAKKVIKKIEKDMLDYSNRKNQESSAIEYSIGDQPQSAMGSQLPVGDNDLSYDLFQDGDIILVHDGLCIYGYYRHGGIYDEPIGNFISAQVNQGVIRESKSFYTYTYDEALGSMVNYMNDDEVTRSQTTTSIMGYLRQQLGEPFIITSSKTDETQWYCVKLPWKGWNIYTSIDIDQDFGYMVTPDNIFWDSDLEIFAWGE